MSPIIQLHDKIFLPFISKEKIKARLNEMARKIELDYAGKDFTVIAVLNGAFLVAADLCREFNTLVEIDFIKWTSYNGIESSGAITKSIGLKSDIKDKDILIVEDIIDTGNSMKELIEHLQSLEPKTIRIFTLLHKPEALKHPLAMDYVGFSIPNNFVVGYGLDYNGLGRNLKDIYTLKI